MNLLVYFDSNKDILQIIDKFRKDYSAEIYKIETIDKISFMTKLKNNSVSIKKCNLNLTKYDNIILISSLWHNEVPSPVIRFLEQSVGKIKNIVYVLYNNNKDDKPDCFNKMDRILNLKRIKSYFVTLDKKNIRVRVYQ